MIIKLHDDLEERRILGLIDDDMYYMLKIRDAAFNCDVNEQKRLMRLRYLERRKKKQQQQNDKRIEVEIEKTLDKQIKKQLDKIFEKFSK